MPSTGNPATLADRTFPVWAFHSPLRRFRMTPAEVLDRFGPGRGEVVADLGAGAGDFLPELLKRSGPEGRGYEVDAAPAALDRARGIAGALGAAGRVTVVRASAASIPLVP